MPLHRERAKTILQWVGGIGAFLLSTGVLSYAGTEARLFLEKVRENDKSVAMLTVKLEEMNKKLDRLIALHEAPASTHKEIE